MDFKTKRMNRLFYYKTVRTEKIKEKDENGKEVEKEVSHELFDCFHVDCVVRGFWSSPTTFSLLLNDGHEQATDKELPIYNNKRQQIGSETKRERDWFYSQVNLTKEDAERFKTVTELMYGAVTY